MKANIWETERWWYKESSGLFNSYETFLWTYPRLSKEEKQKKCEKLPYYKLTRITQRVVDRYPSSFVRNIGQKLSTPLILFTTTYATFCNTDQFQQDFFRTCNSCIKMRKSFYIKESSNSIKMAKRGKW